ncbi:MAG: response regulator [Nostocaceae cyanobacterium]|nr:response regulator [Nostocaceae cyanobacterium]
MVENFGSADKENTEDLTSNCLSLEGRQILLVDDDADSRDFVSFVLVQEGAKVITATSGFEALQILPQFPLDILISDIGMPEMDGYMLLREIRSLPSEYNSNIPAIAVTAYAAELDQEKSLGFGFKSHVTKPVDPDELVVIVLQVLGGRI